MKAKKVDDINAREKYIIKEISRKITCLIIAIIIMYIIFKMNLLP